MDRETIRRAAEGRRRGGRERARLAVYIVLVVAIASWLATRTGDDQGRQARQAAHPDTPRRYTPLARVDPARLAGVRDDTPDARAWLEPEARDHLLSEASHLVYGDMETLGVAAVPREELLADPAAHRGQPVWALGTLRWFEPDTAREPHAFRGEILDEQGRTWTFLVVSVPWGVEEGDVVRVSGFFLKVHDMLRPDRSFAGGPLLVGEELLPSAFRIDPVTELRADLFDDVRDHDLNEASRPLDSLAFFELLSYVDHADPDALFGPAGGTEPVPARELLEQTARWRGRPVTVRGQLLEKQRAPLGPMGENPLGVAWVWDLYLLNYRHGVVRALTLHEPVGIEREDLVDVDGVYFRRFAYENRYNDPVMAAVVIAGRVRPFVVPEDEVTPFIQRLVIWGGMGLMAIILAALAFERRRTRRDRGRSATRRKRLLRLPGRLNPAPPAGSPPGAPADPSRRPDPSSERTGPVAP